MNHRGTSRDNQLKWWCNNNNKIPFQIKFTYVICCGDGSALPGIEHRVTRRGESEKKHTKKGTKNFSFDEKEGIQLWRKIIYANWFCLVPAVTIP